MENRRSYGFSDRMEVGKGGVKCALDEVHDLYGFENKCDCYNERGH